MPTLTQLDRPDFCFLFLEDIEQRLRLVIGEPSIPSELSPVASCAPSPSVDQGEDLGHFVDNISITFDKFHFDTMADPADPALTPLAALTPETLAAIAAFAAFTQQQNQPPPPPPLPIVPPFMGSGATLEFGSKSLPALFPSIDSKIILDIVSHALTPLDLPRLLSPLAVRQDHITTPSFAPSTGAQTFPLVPLPPLPTA
ncbi:hypothetical protein B0H14DRAFT_3858826 [Mycena olivaceomarginata]|nr:hypothetical protein B0H14DRAFT_3858826 [Mycena olivaceomarginata]